MPTIRLLCKDYIIVLFIDINSIDLCVFFRTPRKCRFYKAIENWLYNWIERRFVCFLVEVPLLCQGELETTIVLVLILQCMYSIPPCCQAILTATNLEIDPFHHPAASPRNGSPWPCNPHELLSVWLLVEVEEIRLSHDLTPNHATLSTSMKGQAIFSLIISPKVPIPSRCWFNLFKTARSMFVSCTMSKPSRTTQPSNAKMNEVR